MTAVVDDTTRWRGVAETLQSLRDIDDIAIKRGGRRVAFVAAPRCRGGATRRAVCVYDATTGETTEMSDGRAGARLPRWTAGDGLAFVADGDGGSELVLHSSAGRRTVRLPGVVEDLRPGPGTAELLALTVAGGARELLRVDTERASAAPIGLSRAVWEYDCGPGRPIVMLASDDHTAEGWYGATLQRFDPSRGTVTDLHWDTDPVSMPRLAPDGRRLAFIAGYATDRGLVRGFVRLLDLASGGVSTVAPALEDVCWLGWTDDGGLFAAGWRGMQAYLVELRDGAVARTLWEGAGRIGRGHMATAAVSPDGAAAAVAVQAPGRPPELELLSALDDREWEPVTQVNAAVDMPYPERLDLRWQSPDGTEIEGAVLLPRQRREQPAPLVVVVHGGPTGLYSHDFAPPGSGLSFPLVLAAAGFAVLLPNPRGSSGYGQAFSRALVRDVGGGELDDILAGVDACCELAIADPERVGIMGNSWGGFMSAWAIGASDRFRAAVPMACISDWVTLYDTAAAGRGSCRMLFEASPAEDPHEYARSSPLTRVHTGSAPALVVHGACDQGVPPAQGLALHQALRRLGVPTELAHYPGEGHSIQDAAHQLDLAERIVEWFQAMTYQEGTHAPEQ